jgi:prevent-host-death family protein
VKTATAKDLRQKTAALLDDVRRGQAVVITYRGKSIAVLTPVKKAGRKNLHLADMGCGAIGKICGALRNG